MHACGKQTAYGRITANITYEYVAYTLSISLLTELHSWELYYFGIRAYVVLLHNLLYAVGAPRGDFSVQLLYRSLQNNVRIHYFIQQKQISLYNKIEK